MEKMNKSMKFATITRWDYEMSDIYVYAFFILLFFDC